MNSRNMYIFVLSCNWESPIARKLTEGFCIGANSVSTTPLYVKKCPDLPNARNVLAVEFLKLPQPNPIIRRKN